MQPDPRDEEIHELQEQVRSLDQQLNRQPPKRFPIAFILALTLTIGFGVASLFVDSRLWPFLGISLLGTLIFRAFKV
jgi:hypothetical protein